MKLTCLLFYVDMYILPGNALMHFSMLLESLILRKIDVYLCSLHLRKHIFKRFAILHIIEIPTNKRANS